MQKKYHVNPEERFVLNISRESLATIAGTATESLIRTLSDFRDVKLVDTSNGGVVILDPKKLEQLLN